MVEYGCSGSLALKPHVTGLRLIEGGRRGPSPRGAVHAQGRSAGGAGLRAGMLAAAVGVVIAAMLSLPGLLGSMASARALEAAPTHEVTVAAGDTVWSIAGRSRVEGASAQDVKRWIVENNDIRDSAIYPGQRIVVPGGEG